MSYKLRTIVIVALTIIAEQLKAQSVQDLLVKAYVVADSEQIYLKQAQDLAKHDSDIAEIYFWKNAKACDTNNIDSGLFYGNKAITLLTKLEKWKKICNVKNNIAKYYRNSGNYDVAIKFSLEALQIAEQKKLWRWQIDLLSMISLCYHDWEDYDKGIQFGKKSLALCESHKDSIDYRRLSFALNTLAINHDDNGEHEEAIRLHKLNIERAKNTKDTLYSLSSLNNIGNSLRQMKKYKEALPWIYTSLDITERTKDDPSTKPYYSYQKATLCTNLGNIFSITGELKKADSVIALAKKWSTESEDAEKLRDYYSLAYEHAKRNNRLEEALTAQEQYLNIRDSLYNAKRLATVTEMETKYNVAQKEKSLLEAKAENIQRSKLAQVLGLVALASVIIGFLLFRQQKIKRLQEAQAYQLKEAIAQVETQNKLHHQRLTISRDLHDNIGAQLTFIISAVDNLKYAYKAVDESIINRLSKIGSFTRETITDLRDTIWAMNSDEFSFEDMRMRLTNAMDVAKNSGQQMQFDFDVAEDLSTAKINTLQGINLYRCLQEAVNNAMKHAQASSIKVSIVKAGAEIIATIKDDGKGLDKQTVQASNGLTNMRNRMEEINGSATIDSTIGVGTTIILKFITPS
jgi:signal transduction histidine kinase/tetratricopeptide (TPR) repeat protein